MKSSVSVPPTTFVVFGGAGDLAWRKLVPAFFDLFADKSLPEDFSIVGVGRNEMSDDAFRKHLQDGVANFSAHAAQNKMLWGAFAPRLSYLEGDFEQASTYRDLAGMLAKREHGDTVQTVFYLATPPAFFGVIPGMLKQAGLSADRTRARLVVEKPIGKDLESSRALNRRLLDAFDESQIYRIDHYLGKETVQNILAFRFSNPTFEPVWNRRYIDHVAITVAETVGVEHRASYYEGAGALRDMMQNHLMQILCLVAMEPVVSFEADEVRNKKADVLRAIRHMSHEDVAEFAVRGQYAAGRIGGRDVRGYRHEEGVAADSSTETFAALALFVDNWRWQGVPFYLRTGKRLAEHAAEVVLHFRPAPHAPFPEESRLDWQPSRLVISIEPAEGLVLRFQAKQPGRHMRLQPVDMRFNYADAFRTPSRDAYETLLWDVMTGDATLFMREDQVEAAWSVLAPILEVWGASPARGVHAYPAGSWGPDDSDALLARYGHAWSRPTHLNGHG